MTFRVSVADLNRRRCVVPVDDRIASARLWSVIQAWGFQYVSNIVWLKDKFGLGYWVRNEHEVLLICRRGGMPGPLPA